MNKEQNRAQKFGLSFTEGMDKDSSFNKYSNNRYLNAENFRFITDEEGSTGMLVGDVGDVLKIESRATRNGEIQKFVGWTTLRSDLLLFRIKYFHKDRIYTDLFRISKEQIESKDVLNINDAIPIFRDKAFGNAFDVPIRALARRESKDVDKIYWIDGVSLKYCIIDENTNKLREKDFEALPHLGLASIEITDTTGGNLPAGRVQYTYQLYNVRGSVSLAGPFSNMYNVTESTNTSLPDFKGTEPGKNTGKGCIISIQNIDQSFDRIRIFRILYNDAYLDPEVFVVADQDINEEDIKYIDNTSIGLRTATLYDVVNLRLELLPETLETKNNILFVGNVEEKSFDADSMEYEFNVRPLEILQASILFYAKEAKPFQVVSDSTTYNSIAGQGAWAGFDLVYVTITIPFGVTSVSGKVLVKYKDQEQPIDYNFEIGTETYIDIDPLFEVEEDEDLVGLRFRGDESFTVTHTLTGQTVTTTSGYNQDRNQHEVNISNVVRDTNLDFTLTRVTSEQITLKIPKDYADDIFIVDVEDYFENGHTPLIIFPPHTGGIDNIDVASTPEYHIDQLQTFEGGEFYDDCPGAMVGWTLHGIHSRALRNRNVRIGDVIQCYMIGTGGNEVINKIAVVTALPGLRTTEVNIPLWGGKDGEIKPELRTLYSFGYFIDDPQTKEDGRIFHLRVKHLGKVKDMDNVVITRA